MVIDCLRHRRHEPGYHECLLIVAAAAAQTAGKEPLTKADWDLARGRDITQTADQRRRARAFLYGEGVEVTPQGEDPADGLNAVRELTLRLDALLEEVPCER